MRVEEPACGRIQLGPTGAPGPLLVDPRSLTDLRTHRPQAHTWELPAEATATAWSSFRVLQTGPNSNSHHYLCLGGIELYGEIVGGA